MSKIFQLVIFTRGTQEYAEAILSKIDPNNLIVSLYTRKHLDINGQKFYKNLKRIHKDLSRIVIVDNSENVVLQKQNLVLVREFNQKSKNDDDLKQLMDFVKKQPLNNPQLDLREVFKNF